MRIWCHLKTPNYLKTCPTRFPGTQSASLHPELPRGLLKVNSNSSLGFNLHRVKWSHSVMSDSLRPPWTAARQASLSITNSHSLLKLMSIELVMPSNHLILCHPLLLLPPIPPSIRVFSNESTLCTRWPNIADVKKNSTPLIMKGMQILKTSNARVSD